MIRGYKKEADVAGCERRTRAEHSATSGQGLAIHVSLGHVVNLDLRTEAATVHLKLCWRRKSLGC